MEVTKSPMFCAESLSDTVCLFSQRTRLRLAFRVYYDYRLVQRSASSL